MHLGKVYIKALTLEVYGHCQNCNLIIFRMNKMDWFIGVKFLYIRLDFRKARHKLVT